MLPNETFSLSPTSFGPDAVQSPALIQTGAYDELTQSYSLEKELLIERRVSSADINLNIFFEGTDLDCVI